MPDPSPDASPLAQRLAEAGMGAGWLADETDNDLSPERVGHRIGPYKLLEKLGEGGFGAVWAAEQREPIKRRVALKIIKLGMDTRQVVGRFEAERQALALMDHPNIAKVLEAGATEEGRPYFVMELVRGVPITTYCQQQKLPVRERVELLTCVCQAIQHAHQKGIIHRDIKPNNILVTLHDGVPVPKVIDFGIAKATQQELTDKTVYTRLHQFVGTPAYMSPEQAEMSGLDVDTRSDIYSLGVLLYELLAGEPPFDSKSLLATGIDEMRKIIREKEPVRPSTKLSEITSSSEEANSSELRLTTSKIERDLDWIAMKCLEKDRTRRYETANALADDLRRHLQNEPVQARPPSKLYQFCKLVRRNKAAVAAFAAVVLALLAGATVSLWQASAATKAKNETVASLAEQREISYSTSMSAVGAALQNMNFGRARQLLEAHIPAPGQEDLRDFEWYHFHEIVERDDGVVLGEHPSGARELHAAPDGTILTTNSNRIFGGFSGKLLSWTGAAGTSPTALLDLDGVTAIALSKDGKRIAIARGVEIEIRSRSRPSEIEIKLENWHAKPAFKDAVREMDFCQNDQKLAVSTMNPVRIQGGAIFQIIDLATDTAVPLRRDPLPGHVTYMEESKDGTKLALCVSGMHIVIIDLVASVQETQFRMADFGGRNVTPLTFVRDDQLLATASDAGHIDLWDTATWEHVRRFEAHVVSITDLAESPNGRWLASAGLDQVIHLWDLESTDARPYHTLRGHRDEVWGVTFQPDGETLLSCSRDATVRRWSLEPAPSQRTLWQLPEGTQGGQLYQDYLLTGEQSGQFRVWLNASLATTGKPEHFESPLADRLFIPLEDGIHWLSASNPPGETMPGMGIPIELHCAQTLRQGEHRFEKVSTFPEFSLSTGRYTSHSTANRLVIYGAIDGKPHWLVWDLKQSRLLQLIPSEITEVATTALSPDAQVAVLGSRTGEFEVADLHEGTSTILQQQALSWIGALAIMPGNRFALAGGLPGNLVVIDLQTGAITESVSATLLGIQAMDLSPNGTRLATGDAQGIIKLWALNPLREVGVLGHHPGMIDGVRFSQDGKTLTSVDRGEWRVWRAE